MTDHPQWMTLEKSLGPFGRLGIAAHLFSPNKHLEKEITFNADVAMPMASTAKIAIAMLASAQSAGRKLSLDEQLEIRHPISPGLARSPLDHLFYLPFEMRRHETVDRLLGFMIHRSDNTASDVLLRRLGGVEPVMKFVRDLGISEFHFRRTFAQLIAFYYGVRLPLDRGPHVAEILRAIQRLRRPYICREVTEQALIDSGEDCCTPRAMVGLLDIIATQPSYAVAYSHMEHCAGGLNRIRKGLSEHTRFIKRFAHKTGSLGGVANDAGMVEFVDGSIATICIMTCRASVPVEVRDHQIAHATRLVIAEAVHRASRQAESHAV